MAMGDNRGPRGRKRRKVCAFCVDKVEHIDYKDAGKLRRYTSERAKILPRRTTGTCAMHQRQLARPSDCAAALCHRLTSAPANEKRPAVPKERPGVFMPCRSGGQGSWAGGASFSTRLVAQRPRIRWMV